MGKVERSGTYRGKVLEHGVSVTSKNSFPQWVARLSAEQMFVPEDEREEFTKQGYEISEEGWIDCSDWGWTITGYFVLFNNEKALLNYEQVITATGWDGADFSTLSDMDLTEHDVQFRCDEEEYNDAINMKVQWIDEVGAPINRELATVDADEAKALNKKFKGLMHGKAKAAPTSAAKGPVKTPPASAKTPAPAAKKAAPPAAKAAEPAAEADGFETMTKEAAWDGLVEKSGLEDDALADSWIAACEAVAPDKDEEAFTETDWAQVHATVMAGASGK